MLRFATLGPQGSNHELVTGRYLAFHGVSDRARLRLVLDFAQAFAGAAAGEIDHVVMAAVHPQTTAMVARFWRTVPIVDTFIAPGRPLGVLTRREVERPRTIGLMPATRDYVDLARWQAVTEEPSTVTVAEGLLAGRYDSGIAALELAARYPERLRVDEEIGSPHDAWLVFGREPTCRGDLLAWLSAPAARLYDR